MAFRDEKKLRRWMVFRVNPWAIVAFFATEAEARTKALELGADHIVQVCKKRRELNKKANTERCTSPLPRDAEGEKGLADVIGNAVRIPQINASEFEDEV